jgi:hypothetical protein
MAIYCPRIEYQLGRKALIIVFVPKVILSRITRKYIVCLPPTFKGEVVMCGPNAARGEDIVELGGKGAHLLRHGGNVVRQHAHPFHAHAQPAQLPRKEVSVRVLEQREKERRKYKYRQSG